MSESAACHGRSNLGKRKAEASAAPQRDPVDAKSAPDSHAAKRPHTKQKAARPAVDDRRDGDAGADHNDGEAGPSQRKQRLEDGDRPTGGRPSTDSEPSASRQENRQHNLQSSGRPVVGGKRKANDAVGAAREADKDEHRSGWRNEVRAQPAVKPVYLTHVNSKDQIMPVRKDFDERGGVSCIKSQLKST